MKPLPVRGSTRQEILTIGFKNHEDRLCNRLDDKKVLHRTQWNQKVSETAFQIFNQFQGAFIKKLYQEVVKVNKKTQNKI